MTDQNQLIDQNGERLYLTEDERQAFMKAANAADPQPELPLMLVEKNDNKKVQRR